MWLHKCEYLIKVWGYFEIECDEKCNITSIGFLYKTFIQFPKAMQRIMICISWNPKLLNKTILNIPLSAHKKRLVWFHSDLISFIFYDKWFLFGKWQNNCIQQSRKTRKTFQLLRYSRKKETNYNKSISSRT